jgi:hypothetical protein
MSKKVKIIGGVVAVIVAVVLYLVLTGGGASAEDIDTAEQGDSEMSGKGGVLENPSQIEMPETSAEADSLADAVDLGEFDPNDI